MDLGCGAGRLAVHAVPTLIGGSYIGVDISQTMLKRAKARIAAGGAESFLQRNVDETNDVTNSNYRKKVWTKNEQLPRHYNCSHQNNKHWFQ